MKKRSARWLRSALCLMLAAMLALGTCVTAFAEEMGEEPAETKETLNYVSIGDSMTNGYCFTGYSQKSTTDTSYNFLEGKGVYGAGAYPLQFEKYLEGVGYNVNHTKLAPSATLAGDLWYVLGGRDLPLDGWGGMFDYVGGYRTSQPHPDVSYDERCATDELKAYYQNAIKDADIMTICLGNAEFGAYLMDRITTALGLMGAKTDPEDYVTLQDALNYSGLDSEQQALVQQAYNYMVGKLKAYVPSEQWDQYNLDTVCDMLTYATAGFLFNYKGVLDCIMDVNPDVEIIQIGLMNTTYGMTISMDDGSKIPVGDIMDGLFGMLNAYIAGLPATMQLAGQWKDATFFYAEQPNPLFISQQFAALKDANWGKVDSGRLDGSVVRARNVTAFNDVFVNTGILAGIINGMNGNAYEAYLTNEALRIEIGDVSSYEKDSTSYAASNPLKVYSVMVYLALEDALAESTKTQDIPLSSLTTLTDMDALQNVFSSFQPKSDDLRKELAAFLTSTDEMKGMMKVYALFKVGNGMSVHPTPAGHDNIAASVIAAYDGQYTSFDKTKDNVIVALNALYDILEQYGPEAMEYAYQYALENGYIDQLQTALDELKADLEGQVGAYVDELVPAIEGTIAALQGDAEELKAQLTALKTALDAKLAELEAQLEAAGEDATAAVEQAIAQTEAVIASLEAAIAEVEGVLTEIGEAVTQLQAALEEIASAVEDMSDAAVAIGESVEDMLAILASSADLTVEKAVAAVDAARAAVDAAVELLANAEDAFGGVIDEVSGVASGAAEAVEGICEDTLAMLAALVETLTGITAEDVAAAVEALNAQAQAQIDAIKNELNTQINEAAGELNAQLAAKKAELVTITSNIANEIATKQQELEAAANAQIAELQAQIDAKRAELEAAGAEAAAEIEAQIAELQAQLEAKQQELAAAIDAAKSDIEAAYADAKAAVEAEIANLEAQIAEATAALQAAADAKIAEINAELAAATEKLEAAAGEAAAMIEQIVSEAQTAVEETKAAAEAIYAEVTVAAEALLADAEALANDVLVQVQEKIEEIVAAWNDAYGAATSSEYTVDDESYYVALGDDSAVSESYVDMLSKAISEEYDTTLAYKNLAKSGETVMTVGDTIAANAADIVKADLITLGFSNATFANEVIRTVLGKVTPDLDWSTYVTDDGVQYVEQALDQIRQLLIDNGISGTVQGYDMTQAVMTTIESYAFSCVAYACGLPVLVNSIHEINPEALVIIVGQYNPFDNVTLNMDGAVVDLSEYIDYLVSAAAVHATAYCMLTGNAIYVDAPDAQVKNTDTEFDASDLISLAMTNSAALYPSEEGHQYICDKILEALDIKTAEPESLLGDVNSDGVVNISDVRLTHQYVAEIVDATALNLAVGDVNGDGSVNISDVRLIHRYVAEYITKFPVEA